MYIYIFLCVPLQFLGLLFTVFSIYYLRYYQNMKGIRELYEANIFESSKEVSEIVSLLFFIRLPFQFLETFFVTSPRYCQDVSFERYIDLCNFKLKEESDILFRSVFLALSNSFLSYNIV